MNAQVNWFDFVTVVMIGMGLWIGRKRGMSSEILSLALWLGIVFLGAWSNPHLGGWLARTVGFSAATSFTLAYLLVAAVLGFSAFLLKRWQGEKLVSGDVFGRLEYYLGMIAGVVRFLCILVAALALFHAPKISEQQLQAQLRAQNEDLGSIYFPPFGQIQKNIFYESLTGRFAKEHLHPLLIEVDPNAGIRSTDNIYRSRERLVEEAGGLR
jgi:uncharacterized membrane protein required for colicin V production